MIVVEVRLIDVWYAPAFLEKLLRTWDCEAQAGVQTKKELPLDTVQLRRVHCARGDIW